MSRFIGVVTLVVLVLFSFGFSQASIGFKGIGGHLSMNDPSVSGAGSADPGFGLGFGVNANLGEIIPGLFIIPEINYWSTSKSVEGIDWKISDFQINANVHYFISKVFQGFFAGGGLGLNFVKSEVDIPTFDFGEFGTFGGGTESATENKIGINLEAGWRQPFSPSLSGFAMVRYQLISDMNTLSILLGATFNLGSQ